jgi:uncharacterized membrane protein
VKPDAGRAARIFLAALFCVSGVGHFARADVYARMIPPGFPFPRDLVLLSGAAELIVGPLLLSPAHELLAGWGATALLVAVFPANVYMALAAGSAASPFPAIAPFWAWARLPFQLALIACAWSGRRRIVR